MFNDISALCTNGLHIFCANRKARSTLVIERNARELIANVPDDDDVVVE